ncbi:MAG: hypothetical protein JJU00_13015 [Opitutales bacterium]|nr:hypothetical protein [Opitutales bacterium]
MTAFFESSIFIGVLLTAACLLAAGAAAAWFAAGVWGLLAYPFALWALRGLFLALERVLIAPHHRAFPARRLPWEL